MSDPTPPLSDPISRAAAASVGYTPKMHADMWELIKEQISDLRPRSPYAPAARATHPAILDLYETAIFHLAYSDDPSHAVSYYDWELGGYPYFGGLLGDYRRGLRVTTLLMQIVGTDYMDMLSSPAHEHNLYLIALGAPATAEERSRHLLDLARERAKIPEQSWDNPLSYKSEEGARRAYVMYEVVWLQTLCDALTMQGKLADAETVMNEALDQPRAWDKYGRPDKSHTGSNPYARRALVRALAGNVDSAFEDFKAADTFAENYTSFMFYRSQDWHHKTLYAAFLARLGYLSGAQGKLDRMNIERIRAYRPLTSAEFDLASAEIAYARGDYEKAAEHAERVRAWGIESGHKHMQARAAIILAKVLLRSDDFEKATALLTEAKTIADSSGFRLQQVDALVVSGYLGLLSGDVDRAEKVAAEAETISEELNYGWGGGDAMHLWARCAEAGGDTEAALKHAEWALSLRDDIQDPKASHTRGLIERVTNLNTKQDDT